MEINSAVRSSFQMVATQINAITFKNDFLDLPEDGLKVKTDCEYKTDMFEDNDEYRGGLVTLIVKVTAFATVENKKKKMTISISLTGGFYDKPDVSKEKFQSMLGINGCAALYSIARAQIINLVAQSVMQGHIILPMTNFFKLKEQKDASEKK